MAQQVILSGMQPTGSLHLGNYEGALKNWISLQDDYEMYCCIVDWHSLTSLYDKTEVLKDQIFQMAVDYVAAGLDPEKCAIFVQSQVKEHAELHLLLSMVVPTPWLERVPSYKEKSKSLGLDSYGFLGYPLLQAADILLYRANFVPVGKDQLPHIELTREIARRFNGLYGEVFPEPQDKLTKFAAVPGTDGNRMSKSYGNHICLSDTPEETANKISKMFTDPQKLRKGDPGRPEICPVFTLHQIYSSKEEIEKIDRDCRSGALGCVADKKHLAENINKALAPIRARAAELRANPDTVWDILRDGARKAGEKAGETMQMVREAMRLMQ
ncbi:MAG TPA: tryptophan--tRNA ligase [candidate division Zixibacteria bacterium]|nr:tryptophan--tRNA ligase [candidate division Zixibacteria bacterium]